MNGLFYRTLQTFMAEKTWETANADTSLFCNLVDKNIVVTLKSQKNICDALYNNFVTQLSQKSHAVTLHTRSHTRHAMVEVFRETVSFDSY